MEQVKIKEWFPLMMVEFDNFYKSKTYKFSTGYSTLIQIL